MKGSQFPFFQHSISAAAFVATACTTAVFVPVSVVVLESRFTGETGTILKVLKNPDGASRAMVLTDMSSKELEVRASRVCYSTFVSNQDVGCNVSPLCQAVCFCFHARLPLFGGVLHVALDLVSALFFSIRYLVSSSGEGVVLCCRVWPCAREMQCITDHVPPPPDM